MFHDQNGHKVNDIDVYKYKSAYIIIHYNMTNLYHYCEWESKYKVQLKTTSNVTYNLGWYTLKNLDSTKLRL
jgi:hypothetical protein